MPQYQYSKWNSFEHFLGLLAHPRREKKIYPSKKKVRISTTLVNLDGYINFLYFKRREIFLITSQYFLTLLNVWCFLEALRYDKINNITFTWCGLQYWKYFLRFSCWELGHYDHCIDYTFAFMIHLIVDFPSTNRFRHVIIVELDTILPTYITNVSNGYHSIFSIKLLTFYLIFPVHNTWLTLRVLFTIPHDLSHWFAFVIHSFFGGINRLLWWLVKQEMGHIKDNNGIKRIFL